MKKIVITTTLLLVAIVVLGQWFAEVSGGMIFPVRTKNNLLYYNSEFLYDEINDDYYDKKETIKFNIIQSPSLNFKGGYLLNNEFEFGLNLNYANNDIVRTINQNNKTIKKDIVRTLSPGKNIETIQTYIKSYYTENVSGEVFCGYNYRLNSNISITPTIGVSFNVINIKRVDSLITKRYYYESFEKFSEIIIIENNEFPFSYSFKNLINFSTGINFSYDINKKFSISLSTLIELFNKQFTPEIQIKYYQEKIVNGEIIEIDKNEYVYELQGPIETFFVNRYRISLGICYYFGNNKNKTNYE